MKINKISNDLLNLLNDSIKNYVSAWHKIPYGLDSVDSLKIKRVRYIYNWGTKDKPEVGYVIEFDTPNSSYRELLSISELGLSVSDYKDLINTQSSSFILFGKDVLTNQFWYEYPVIYGILDDVFDRCSDYEFGGMYSSNDYGNFKKKFD